MLVNGELELSSESQLAKEVEITKLWIKEQTSLHQCLTKEVLEGKIKEIITVGDQNLSQAFYWSLGHKELSLLLLKGNHQYQLKLFEDNVKYFKCINCGQQFREFYTVAGDRIFSISGEPYE